MLFNSNEFFVFFGFFVLLYWAARESLVGRNVLLLAGSYVFYCWWDYRFGALLLFTSLWDFTLARLIDGEPRAFGKKCFLTLSLGMNLGVLAVFKYFNFFREGLEALLGYVVGKPVHWSALYIVLPVGVSFYTFQSMAYVIDVYRGKVPASRKLVEFLAFVSFFPQLVAGPIERASHMFPQFSSTLSITREHLEHGMWLVLWGLFEKVVLADNLAPLAELAFDHANASLPVTVMGTCAFGLQIYCDFSGYSNMARGLARMLGFELAINFNAPYVASSLRDFWHRWHISLSSWIRDYLYVPLGGNRLGESRTRLNLLVAMMLAGLWHGAAANFVLWGAWHGFGLVAHRMWEERQNKAFELSKPVSWLLTMIFVFVGWTFFRCRSLERVGEVIQSLSCLDVPLWWQTYLQELVILAIPVIAMQVWQNHRKAEDTFTLFERPTRVLLQGGMLLCVVAWWAREGSTFIYFQF